MGKKSQRMVQHDVSKGIKNWPYDKGTVSIWELHMEQRLNSDRASTEFQAKVQILLLSSALWYLFNLGGWPKQKLNLSCFSNLGVSPNDLSFGSFMAIVLSMAEGTLFFPHSVFNIIRLNCLPKALSLAKFAHIATAWSNFLKLDSHASCSSLFCLSFQKAAFFLPSFMVFMVNLLYWH